MDRETAILRSLFLLPSCAHSAKQLSILITDGTIRTMQVARMSRIFSIALMSLEVGARCLLGADALDSGEFQWTVGAPLVLPADRPEDPCYSVKDPSIVQFEGR